MEYKIESDFECLGLRCVVIFTKRGYRCGYVGVTSSHPLHGISYSIKSKYLNFNTPYYYFDVHGGITYSNNHETYPIKSNNLWWFGFDTAHYRDSRDLNLALKYNLITKESYDIESDFTSIFAGTVKSLKYCIKECQSLAKQLIKIKS